MYAFPTRKISETLLDYAQPLVAMVGSHATEEQLQRGFLIAVTIWNAFVLDRARGGTEWQDQLRAQLGDQWTSLPVLRELVERKKSLFADDMRLIGDFRVRFVDGELRLWAEARDSFQSLASGSKSQPRTPPPG